MLLYSATDVKQFMSALLKEGLFHTYEARGVILQTFTKFDINCIVTGETNYHSWKTIQPVIFELIKGKNLPKYIKIQLALSGTAAESINENAAVLHLTITYENNAVSILTGCAQKTFSLDKNLENSWDGYVTELLGESVYIS